MSYLLDANVFIESGNRYYSMDICPAFWDWIIVANKNGKVFSLDKVKQELCKIKKDNVSEWARMIDSGERKSKLFLSSQAAETAMSAVAAWVDANDYEMAAKEEFFGVADYYLVAYARQARHTIVTEEIFSSGKKKIKIPNVCRGLNVECINTFDMLKREHVRFTRYEIAGSSSC